LTGFFTVYATMLKETYKMVESTAIISIIKPNKITAAGLNMSTVRGISVVRCIPVLGQKSKLFTHKTW